MTPPASLLEIVSRELGTRGCTLAVGPMDQNTWRDYRFVTERWQPTTIFSRARLVYRNGLINSRADGFREIRFVFLSAGRRFDDFGLRVSTSARNRMVAQGIQIRPLCRDQLDSDLKQISRSSRLPFATIPSTSRSVKRTFSRCIVRSSTRYQRI